jgi:flagellar hook-associated protein 3 FlgL
MIGRVTELMTTQQILGDINQSQAQLDATQQQLASGKSINQPSDNPYGASLAVSLNDDLSSLTGYTNNVTDGTAWTQAAGTALQNMQTMVQRVQDLVVQAANGTQSASDLSDTADEVNQLIDSIKQEANAQYNGQYVLSGNASGTTPYSATEGDDVYHGGSNTPAPITREIGPNSSVTVSVDISQLMGNTGSDSDPPGGDLLSTLRTISSDMTNDNTGDLSSQLANLQSNLTTLDGIQAGVGAGQDQLSLASTRIASLQTADTAALSNDEDADMASTMTTYSNEQASFTAALRAGADIVQTSLMNFLSTSG